MGVHKNSYLEDDPNKNLLRDFNWVDYAEHTCEKVANSHIVREIKRERERESANGGTVVVKVNPAKTLKPWGF